MRYLAKMRPTTQNPPLHAGASVFAPPRISVRSSMRAPKSGAARRYKILRSSTSLRRLWPGVGRKIVQRS